VNAAQLSELVEDVLGAVPFEPPISLDYCREIRKSLLAKSKKISAEVYSMRDQLTVRVQDGSSIYQVTLPLE
jgi:hypothetical protein